MTTTSEALLDLQIALGLRVLQAMTRADEAMQKLIECEDNNADEVDLLYWQLETSRRKGIEDGLRQALDYIEAYGRVKS